MDMPERLFVTKEDHYWPTFRNFIASDLDHGPEYPQYVRLDIVHGLLVALQNFVEECNNKELIYDGVLTKSDAWYNAEEIINKTKEILNEG